MKIAEPRSQKPEQTRKLRALLRINLGSGADRFHLNADFEMPLEGITVLRGHSGSGKSTLLQCLAGLLPVEPDSELWFGDRCWLHRNFCLAPQRRELGMVFQDALLFPHLSVLGNLKFARRHRCFADSPPRLQFADVINRLGLEQLLKRRPAELSGGQQRRVALARSLLREPALLLFDEPLSGLDHDSRQTLIRYLLECIQQLRIPTLWVSHDLNEASLIGDHLLLMSAGRIEASGPLLQLCSATDTVLSRSREAGAVLEGTVTAEDRRFELTEVSLGSQHLLMHRLAAATGETVRIRIPGNDVSLSLNPAVGSSILNSLKTTVDSITELDNAETLVRLKLETQYLLARITAKSTTQLGLHPGQTVYAQIKASALMKSLTQTG